MFCNYRLTVIDTERLVNDFEESRRKNPESTDYKEFYQRLSEIVHGSLKDVPQIEN